jgi:uncharacterized protein (TIGR04255 family)
VNKKATTMVDELEQLPSPPIVEVVCGLVFDQIPNLTPVSLGVYWVDKRGEYPKHQLLPAIADEGELDIDAFPPLRTWFLSQNEVFVIQVQHDRFYVNWRARGHEYPRFSDHGGNGGILSRFKLEFQKFCEFASDFLQVKPSPRRIELTKVDHLVQGQHWSDFSDLSQLLPALRGFASFTQTTSPAIGVRYVETFENARLAVAIDSALAERPDKTRTSLVKLETRYAGDLDEDIHSSFTKANHRVNAVFKSLIPKDERAKRFSSKEVR